jgi:hypothetical protein
MNIRHLVRFLAAPAILGWALTTPALSESAVPSASAQGCPDVEMVFARGTGEPPGVGPTGQAFADSLRHRIAARSFGVYPVNYPANDQWEGIPPFAPNVGETTFH